MRMLYTQLEVERVAAAQCGSADSLAGVLLKATTLTLSILSERSMSKAISPQEVASHADEKSGELLPASPLLSTSELMTLQLGSS